MSNTDVPPKTKGPPARLLARFGGPSTNATANANAAKSSTVTVPEPTDEDITQWIARNYAWRCAICCEYQPLATPSFAILTYAKIAVQRSMYQRLCTEARIPPNDPPPLPPSVIPPPIDEECLFRQICRDCGGNGLKTLHGLPSSAPSRSTDAAVVIVPFHQQINFPLLKQLLKLSFSGNEASVDAYLQTHGMTRAQDILRMIESTAPECPTDDDATWTKTSSSSSPSSSTVHPSLWLSGTSGASLRQPRWGIQPRHPITCIGYSLQMLGHDDSPLPYYDELSSSAREEAKDNAEAEIMLSGPTFTPTVPPYPQMHPERPDRLRSALGYLALTGLLPHLHKVVPRHAKDNEIKLACEPSHYAKLMQFHHSVLSEVHHADTDPTKDPRQALRLGDTYINHRTLDSAMYALGTTIEVARAIATGRAGRGVVIVRPPGHHADCTHTQGFCIFNNLGTAVKVILEEFGPPIAIEATNELLTTPLLSLASVSVESLNIASLSLSPSTSSNGTDPTVSNTVSSSSPAHKHPTVNSNGATNTTLHRNTKTTIQRILIVDWDLHHGDGTEDMFYDNPNVLFISIHRYDHGAFYPSTGHPNRVGVRKGEGYNINIPLNGVFFGDADYLTLFDYIVMPIARAFSPDFVFVSCGFDAARGDWLGDFDITPAGYAHMTYALSSLAQGKILVALEGGYNLYAIATSTEAITRVLLGENPLPLEAYDDTVNKVAEEYSDSRNGLNASFHSTSSIASSGPVPHGVPRRTPKPETWDTIRTVISVQEKYWPVLEGSRKALKL